MGLDPFHRRLTACFVAALVVVVLIAAPTTAHAQADERPQLDIRPVGQGEARFFDLQAAPGEKRVLQVELRNTGTKPIRARTYSADAYTIVNGGFGMRMVGEAPTGSARWVEYPPEVLDLTPGQVVTRNVTLRVPGEARAGEHIAALAIENAEAIRGSGGVSLDQVVRKAIAVLVTIAGPIQAGLEIVSGEHLVVSERSVVAVVLRNSGNVRLRPQGTVAVVDGAGREVARTAVAMDSFYAGDGGRLEVPLEKRLPPGRYTIAVSLTVPEHGVEVSNPAVPFTAAADPPPSDDRIAGVRVPRVVSDLLGDDERRLPVIAMVTGAVVLALLAAVLWWKLRRPIGRHGARGAARGTAASLRGSDTDGR